MTVTANLHNCAAWVTLTSYAVGARRSNDTGPVKAYQCITAGISGATGPTGTGSSITDGTCVWKYLSAVDYSTLAAYAAALPATLTDAYVGQLWNDAEWVLSSAVTFSGNTTTGTNTITLTAAPGESYVDNPNAQTNALAYNAANGVGIGGMVNYLIPITNNNANSYFSRIQIEANNANTLHNSGLNLFLDNAIFYNTRGGTYVVQSQGGSNGAVRVRNCLILTSALSNGGINIQNSNSPSGAEIYFCTIACTSNVTSSGKGIVGNYHTLTVENCAVFGFNSFGTASTFACSHCMTDNTASLPTGVTGGKTYTSQFVGTTASAIDFREKAGADLQGAGTADSTNGAFDIVGTARPQGTNWDIGCWELRVSGTLVTFDSRSPFESFTSFLRDARSPFESRAGFRRDAPTPLETRSGFQRDAPFPTESKSGFRRDGTLPLEDAISRIVTSYVPFEASRADNFSSRNQLEFRGATLNGMRVPLESLFGVRHDGAVPLENVTVPHIDFQAPFESLHSDIFLGEIQSEFLTSITDDVHVPFEVSSNTQINVHVPLEFRGVVTLVVNGFAPLEFLTSLSGNARAATEFRTAIVKNDRMPIEDLSGAIITAHAPIESRTSLKNDSKATIEFRTSAVKDGVVPTEARTVTRADADAPLEFRGAVLVTIDGFLPFEFRGSLVLSGRSPFESSRVVKRDGTTPFEMLWGRTSDSHVPIESSHTAKFDGEGQLEFRTTSSFTIRTPLESLQGLRINSVQPFEWLAGRMVLAVTALESRHSIALTFSAPMEILRHNSFNVSLPSEILHGHEIDAHQPFENLSSTHNDGLVPFEYRQDVNVIMLNGIAPLEWLASATGEVTIPFEIIEGLGADDGVGLDAAPDFTYVLLAPPMPYGLVATPLGYVIRVRKREMPFIGDLPPIDSVGKQTVFCDVGDMLPTGVMLTGTPIVTIGVHSGPEDAAPNSHLNGDPQIATVTTANGGSGIVNAAILQQIVSPQAGTEYWLHFQCARNDGTDLVDFWGRFTGDAPY